MKKQTYLKPTMLVVALPYQHQLLASSDPDAVITIYDTPAGEGFSGR